MTSLANSPLWVSDVLGILYTLCCLLAAYAFVESCMLRVRRGFVAAEAALLVCVTVVAHGHACPHLMVRKMPQGPPLFPHGFMQWLVELPVAAFVLFLLVAGLLVTISLVQLRTLRERRITPDSVKAALDGLPDGACFSTTDGKMLLINAHMNELAHEAFGMAPTDERLLWERLCAGACSPGFAVEPGEQDGAQPLLAGNGHAWQFSRKQLQVDGRQVIETLAADVSTEYALVRQLEERNARLREMNERLRSYGRDVARQTRAQEVLAAKIRVHDEVGRALVALRVYELQAPEERDRQALLAQWERVTRLLQSAEQTDERPDDWTLLAQAAHAVDVRLVVKGALPEDERLRALAVTVVHECLNNAVRHGEAHEVVVFSQVYDGVWELRVSNDGQTPECPAEETGGLANVRAAVERAGGTLELSWAPLVEARVRLLVGSVDGEDARHDSGRPAHGSAVLRAAGGRER